MDEPLKPRRRAPGRPGSAARHAGLPAAARHAAASALPIACAWPVSRHLDRVSTVLTHRNGRLERLGKAEVHLCPLAGDQVL
jgi:hypothetical protein